MSFLFTALPSFSVCSSILLSFFFFESTVQLDLVSNTFLICFSVIRRPNFAIQQRPGLTAEKLKDTVWKQLLHILYSQLTLSINVHCSSVQHKKKWLFHNCQCYKIRCWKALYKQVRNLAPLPKLQNWEFEEHRNVSHGPFIQNTSQSIDCSSLQNGCCLKRTHSFLSENVWSWLKLPKNQKLERILKEVAAMIGNSGFGVYTKLMVQLAWFDISERLRWDENENNPPLTYLITQDKSQTWSIICSVWSKATEMPLQMPC